MDTGAARRVPRRGESPRLYSFFHLVALRGLRRGEGVGIEWTNIDLDAGLITPSPALVVDNWEVFEDDLKTERSRRR